MLSGKGLAFQERDFFKDHFSEAELRQLLEGRAASDIFSWKSPSFRAMGLEAEKLGDDDLIRLMLQEPRLIRRPLIKIGDQLLIGANQRDLEKALAAR